MGEENRSALEQYAEIRLREERIKLNSKKWATVTVLVLVIVGIIGNFFSNIYLSSSTAKDILEEAFNTTSNQYISYDDNGYAIIGLQTDSKETALLNLREAYLKMSKKQVSNKLNKIAVVIYDSTDKVIFNSNITVDQIMNTNWSSATTYSEFMEMANVQ